MKSRFTSFDLRAIVEEAQTRIVGLRLQNIYDVSSRCLLFKFHKPASKEFLMIESGMRMHLTKYSHGSSASSGNFCLKVRKHLRTRRLISIRQLGIDRIVDMEFYSSQFGNYHLILEFYSAGNIILTDASYRIIAMLRTVHLAEGQLLQLGSMTIGQVYEVEMAQKMQQITMENLNDFLSAQAANDSLKKVLNSYLSLGPSVTDHLLTQLGGNVKVCTILNDTLLMAQCFEEMAKIVNTKSYEGVITFDAHGNYLDYFPLHFSFIAPEQKVLHFPTFNEAVDEFYSQLEKEKIQKKAVEQEGLMHRKLTAIKDEQQKRIQGLQDIQVEYENNADVLKCNFELVTQILAVLTKTYQSKMEWERFNFYLQNERKKGNPMAEAISSVNFDKKTAILQLPDMELDEKKIEVNFLDSIHTNVQRFYDLKRSAADKLQRTLRANQKAIKSAEARIKQDVKSMQIVQGISKLRKIYWFEKFNWFISSENYLVIGGKDAQQNELLVRKYLHKNDLYIHADIHGASSVIIKNPTEQPVPPSTLAQAGTMAICYSRAWEAKIVTSAWWVYEHQVSQTPPTGQYLPSGSFMIRGKKNYLPPAQLVYGFGLLFKVDEESMANHLNERKSTQEFDATKLAELSEKYEKMNIANEEFVGEFPDTDLNLVALSPSTTSSTVVDLRPSVIKPKGRGIKETKQKETNEKKGRETKEKEGKQAKREGKVGEKKEKKIKQKYRDQDEEERQLKLELLGNKPKKTVQESQRETKVSNIQNKLVNRNENNFRNNKAEQVENEAEKVVPNESLVTDVCQPVIDEVEALTDEECEEVRALLEEENITLDSAPMPADEIESVINTLTAKPVEDDNLLFCIPVCAPYATMKDYKYKVKLIPGTLKKGKAAKLALNLFTTGVVPEKEKQLIKAIPESELIQCMIGKCKVSAPNIEIAKKRQKA